MSRQESGVIIALLPDLCSSEGYPTVTKRKLYCRNQHMSRALMRVCEWPQQTARLNILNDAEKDDSEPAISPQLGHNSYNYRSKRFQWFLTSFLAVVIGFS